MFTEEMMEEMMRKNTFTAQRRWFYGLVLTLLLALAGFGLLRESALAELLLDNEVFLPLVMRGEPGGTVPPP